jgi:hypothetical protein
MTQKEFKYLLVQSIGFEPTEIKFIDEGSYKRIKITQNGKFEVFNSYMFQDFAYGNIISFSITSFNTLYITFITYLINE